MEKLNASLEATHAFPLTQREARLPDIPGKAHAVIGMRRAGKTTFLHQLLAQRRTRLPAERSVFVSFDDDRLADLGLEQLDAMLEEHYRRFPKLRGRHAVTWMLDEIQLVPGWERFVRRVLDTERVEIIVSGSSAQMLSREVHTSLRGRGTETVIRPFSFREFLRHRDEEPDTEPARWTSARRSLVENRFREYLAQGGFPEVQGLDPSLRVQLLQGYVDTVLLRDVAERHAVSHVVALRWLTRQCLRNPASLFSVHGFARDLRAQGLGIAKDALHALLAHLTDAFLITMVPLSTESERRRNSNPRKVYPADPAIIGAFDVSGRSNVGHALETVILNELERRKADVGYVRTPAGREVDFHARHLTGKSELIQACADLAAPETLERELTALVDAATEHPRAKRLLLVLQHDQARRRSHDGIEIRPAYEWLLET